MCELIEKLKNLKKSSQSAVDNDEIFTDFNQYMHVHRQVEKDLIEVIESAKSSGRKRLILVCGNVGDGKSHLISYLKHHENNYLDGFDTKNDATESKSRYKNEKQELAEVLSDFNDENIDKDSEKKVIIAINLGVLKNFIDSDEGKNFTALRDYVERCKILEDTEIYLEHENNEIFQHVNFGDYHLYRLVNESIDSPYISELIDKIFCNQQGNVFWEAYASCNTCNICDCCPIKHNYEMLGNPNIKDKVIDAIIETIMKDKIILSTRELLNFFYDITVPPIFNQKHYAQLDKKEKLQDYIQCSLPNLMYEHDDISTFLTHMKAYDFLTQRTEKLDEIITRFNNTEQLGEIFKQYIYDNSSMNYILNTYEYLNIDENKDMKNSLLRYFLRLCKLAAAKESKLETVNQEFKDYIKDLYYANKGETGKLRKLYGIVESCIYFWNGSKEVGYLNLNTNHEDYRLSTPLLLEPDLTSYRLLKREEIDERCSDYINMTFCAKNDKSKTAKLTVNYDLYKMLRKVKDGYRPSASDQIAFTGFGTFISRVSEFSSYKEEVQIGQFNGTEWNEYILKNDKFGDYEFREV